MHLQSEWLIVGPQLVASIKGAKNIWVCASNQNGSSRDSSLGGDRTHYEFEACTNIVLLLKIVGALVLLLYIHQKQRPGAGMCSYTNQNGLSGDSPLSGGRMPG